MKASRTGLNLCNGAILPRGFHHSSASAANRATSARSTLVRSAAGLFTMRDFLAPDSVAGHSRRLYLYAPSREERGSLARVRQGYVRLMARLVMKFGGTSVADIEHIRNVARHVKRE